VARGFRSPTLSDRYFRGPSGRGFVTGNPDLEPETSLQYDLAVRRSAGRTAVALYAYRYDIDDLIERYQEGADFHFRNRGEARLEGVELEAQTGLGDGWSLDLGAAWARGRADSGDPIDDSTAPGGWIGANWAFARGTCSAASARASRRTIPDPPRSSAPAHAARPRRRLEPHEQLELRVAGAQRAGSLLLRLAGRERRPLAGRAVTVGLTGASEPDGEGTGRASRLSRAGGLWQAPRP